MAYGLSPAYHLAGGTIRVSEKSIDASYSTALFLGDPVVLHTDGKINIANPGSVTNNLGVFAGVRYKTSDGEFVYSKSWPSGGVSGATEIKALVYEDRNIVYKVQADQVGTALTEAAIGASGDLTSGSGDTVYGLSGWFLDSSGTWGATQAQVKIVGSAETDGDFTALGTAMDMYVVFNAAEHVYTAAAGVA